MTIIKRSRKRYYIWGKPDSLLSLEEAVVNEEVGIIVTMSQIAGTDAVTQLLEGGYHRKDIDFFIIEEFISVYNVYKYNKVYFSSISFCQAPHAI